MEQDGEERDIELENIQSNSLNLPEDVLIDILSWLPVKSLLRFRSVSKPWKNLIDHPIQSTKILRYPDETQSKTDDYQDLNLTFTSYYHIFGPCNGIFVVLNLKERIALWNPATKQFRPLPVANRPQLSSNPYVDTSITRNDLGFGFDPKTNDYKVLWYRGFGDHPPITQLLVYTLSTNSWRELDDEYLSSFELGHWHQRQSLSFNGVHYWLVWGENVDFHTSSTSLLSFCFSEEQTQDMITIPDHLSELVFPDLAVCGGCIALIYCIFGEGGVTWDEIQSVRVWAMVEKGYWVQKFEIVPFEGIVHPFGIWKNDNVLFKTKTDELVLGDSVSQIWRNIHPIESENLKCLQTFVYSESFVSVKGGDHNGYGSDEEECGFADFYRLSCPLEDSVKGDHGSGSDEEECDFADFDRLSSPSADSVKGGDHGNESDEEECGVADFYHRSSPSAD